MTRATSKPEPSLRQRALTYLARREHSAKELYRKLKPYAAEEDDLDALLQDFRQRGWLSDERFAEQVVHARQGRYGSLKVAHELREKGVTDALVDRATAALDDMQAVRSVWQKKYGKLPGSREEWAKQARFLQSRGFGFDVIKRVLKGAPDDEQ
jgi:regulatory protein